MMEGRSVPAGGAPMTCCRRPDRACRPPRSRAGVWLRFLLAASLVLAAALLSVRGADPSPDEVAALVRQLGSDSFEEREAAGRLLSAAGKAGLPALRRARDGDDAEVRRRAAELVRDIEKRVYGERRVLTGHDNGVLSVALSPD